MALINLSWMLSVGALAVAPLGPDAVRHGVVAALVGSVIAGCVVGALVRRRGEVSCPSSSIAVIYASLVAALLAREPAAGFAQVWASLSLSVVLAGVMLLAASRTGVSRLLQYLPRPVASGFVAGIGALVVLSQVPAVLGAGSRVNFAAWGTLIEQVRPASVVVGLAAAAAAWAYPRTRLPGHPLLAGIATGSVAHLLLQQWLPRSALGPTLEAVSLLATAEGAVRSTWADLTWAHALDTLVFVLPFSALLAFQAVMNAAVTAASVAALVGGRSDIEATLRAQGLANMLAGAACALPISTNAPLSVLAARNGASPMVGVASAVLVLVGAFAIAPVLAHVPLAALAGVLVLSGFAMVDPWTRVLARRARALKHRPALVELLVVASVAAAFCVGSVPLGIAVGLVLVLGILAVRLAKASQVACEPDLLLAPRGAACVHAQGVLFFANAEKIASAVTQAAASASTVVVDLRAVLLVDSTAALALQRVVGQVGADRVLLVGVRRGTVENELAQAGLLASEQRPWFDSREHALAWAGARCVLPHVLPEASNDHRLGPDSVPSGVRPHAI
ncbi:MAG TPA: SulP family inorganic anion transporter [Ramlibacter sp.]|nr:SulP family inorganic anion transporter [Ramlibacter sp.]